MKSFLTNAGNPENSGPEKPGNESVQGREFFGNWKFDLATGQLSLSPRARNLLGLAQGGNYTIRELFRLIDNECQEKAKAWFRMARLEGVLEQVVLMVHPTNAKAISVKLSGFHYAERWESPKMIVGIVEDYTQNVQEERIALSIVNHELRTPLSVMKLKSQMIQKTANPYLPVTHAEMARSIEMHIDGITSLLDQYLSVSAAHGALQPLKTTVFDINALAGQILNDMRFLYKEHRFMHLHTGPYLVRADKYQIMQVLINYLTNAVKFSPRDTQITLESTSDEHSVVMSITDQGAGLPPGLEKRVFERFFRAAGQPSSGSSSKGLGLYLVKQIIERHGGNVWVERGTVAGSVFFFRLPRYHAAKVNPPFANSLTLLSDAEPIYLNHAG